MQFRLHANTNENETKNKSNNKSKTYGLHDIDLNSPVAFSTLEDIFVYILSFRSKG